MRKVVASAVVIGCLVAALYATPAFAYKEDPNSPIPAGACNDCHSLESGATSPTVGGRSVPSTWTFDSEAGTDVGTRKGPHGGYTPGTQKCATCHTIHGGNGVADRQLLPEPTIEDTCFTCHDGTGGQGVYGVIKQRTGFDPAETTTTAGFVNGTVGGVHRVGASSLNSTGTVTIPGGSTTSGDGSIEATFGGAAGAMTCTDCHSPHNSQTVKPFIGDRLRALDDTTSGVYKTNKLLRKRPTLGTKDITEYGTNWCESCHKAGNGNGHPAHSVSRNEDNWYYNRIEKMDGVGSITTTIGALGGDNFGYLMPYDAGNTYMGTQGTGPICQQCHEDGRVVADESWRTDQYNTRSLAASETFNPSLDGSSTTGNPRFQNFPHETETDGLLIESADGGVSDGLCLNCHVL